MSSQTSHTDLPPELWLRIAHFIPDEELYAFASLNHLFLDAAEDRRYRDLVLDEDDPDRLLRKLLKIQNDPKTASRVHTLEIHPRAIRSAWLKQHSKSMRSKTKTKGSSSFFALPSLYLPSLKPLLTLSHPPPPDPQTALTQCPLITTLLASLSGSKSNLTNLEKYGIYWPGAVEDEMVFCFPLLGAIWEAIGSRAREGPKLRVLSVDMPLDSLAELLSSISRAGGLERLENLELRFSACTDESSSPLPLPPPGSSTSTSSSSRRNHPTTDQALHTLARFILSLSSTLTCLTLSCTCPSSSSSQHIDFSPLFQYLSSPTTDEDEEEARNPHQLEVDDSEAPPLPHLSTLTLDLPIDAVHLPDPSGLVAFLEAQLKSGELKTLNLGNPDPNVLASSNPWLPDSLGSEHARWLEGVFDGLSLPMSMSAELPREAESRTLPHHPQPQGHFEAESGTQIVSSELTFLGPSSSRFCRARTATYTYPGAHTPHFTGVEPWAAPAPAGAIAV